MLLGRQHKENWPDSVGMPPQRVCASIPTPRNQLGSSLQV